MKKNLSITAHCIIKNEENFVEYAIRSVVDFVDQIIVFDTGSTDKTVSIILELQARHPNKIFFEEKGLCDKKRHTELREEMLNKTNTEWFMILDGDEVWTKRGMEEVLSVINSSLEVECLIAPFYLCVGDVYHRYYKDGSFEILGKKGFFSPRVIKKIRGLRWEGDYNDDVLVCEDGLPIFRMKNSLFLREKYWHLTHLRRSSIDDIDYSSGGNRKSKRRMTYFIIGKVIPENIPEVFNSKINKISFLKSFGNFLALVFEKISKK